MDEGGQPVIKVKTKRKPKEYLIDRARDRQTQFLLSNGAVRGTWVQANLVLEEMALNHELGPFETLILGQAYVAALLMASTLKGEDRFNLSISVDGPVKGFSVDANAFCAVRGYLLENPIRIPTDWKDVELPKVLGSGTLTLTRFLERKTAPMSGTVEYLPNSLAESLAYYYQQSEQTPSAFVLSLPFDREGNLLGGGGLMLQAMPGSSVEEWDHLLLRLRTLPSVGENAAESHEPSALLDFWFSDLHPQVMESRRVEFFCECSKQKFSKVLTTLPAEDRTEILSKGPFPMETTCHHCNSAYWFERAELEAIWSKLSD